MIKIQFINLSTKLLQRDAQAIVSALAVQVSRDFYPAWGVNANLYLAPAGTKVPTTGYWTIGFFDNADIAGALGYHDVTAEGLPLGKVFVETTLLNGGKVSVVASHECLEMLGDPSINLTAELDNSSSPAKFYAYEVGDPCEDPQFGYAINGVTVSDFVFPEYFESQRAPNSAQFDMQKKITQPFQILPGGYLSVLDLGNLALGWQQVTMDRKGAMLSRPPVGSRRERRSIPRSRWMRSTYKHA
jgi:hypothetical protein